MGKVAGARFAAVILVILAGATGCGGGSTLPGQAGITGPNAEQGTGSNQPQGWLDFPPAIDGHYSRYRLTSDSERTVEGLDYAEWHGDGNYEIPESEDYVIVSGSSDPLAWAVYNLAELDTERPTKLKITIAEAGESPGADPLPLSCWLGVTDYTTNSWAWYGPFVEPTTLVVNCPNRRDRYVSAAHVMSFALLTASSSRFASGDNPDGRTAALIDRAVITTLPADDEDYLVTKPHFATIADVAFGDGGKGASALETWQHVTLYWNHVTDSANPDCEAQQYDVYRRGPGDESRQLIGSVDAPAEQYTDPLDNDAGIDETVPGVTYVYSLQAGNTAGYTSYDAVPVTIPEEEPTPDTLIITAFAVRIENAANGIGFDPEVFDADHTSCAIDANAATNLGLEWIAGTFNGLPFSGADEANWPADMTQDDYDTAFGAARDNQEWNLLGGDASDSRATSDWIVLDSGLEFPMAGEPGPGVVCPDDDPDSTFGAFEAELAMLLPRNDHGSYPSDERLIVSVPSDVGFGLMMDIGFDPAAPVLLGYHDSNGDPLTHLSIAQDTLVRVPFVWGIGGEPADLSQTSLELREFELGDWLSTRVAVDFDYSASAPASGEFTFSNEGGDDYVECIVPAVQLQSFKLYACRLNSGECWSSINKPEEMLDTDVGPGIQPFVTFPEHCWPEIDILQIFQPDPIVRRDPALFYDFESGGMKPQDEAAYNDVLKINGDEFFIYSEGGVYPKAAVKETHNPETITSLEDGIPGVASVAESCGRLLIDISVLTPQGNPGDPVRTYCYKFFNADGSSIGWGEFDVAPDGSLLVSPEGVAWGVNVWDREERELVDRTYDNFTVDGDTVGTATPDVLWFEIEGGWLYDSDQYYKGMYSYFPSDFDNMLIRVKSTASADTYYIEGGLRLAGVNSSGSYILIHEITNIEWRNPGVPGWPGILESGASYSLSLDDPHFEGIEYMFEDELLTTGTNPNI